MLNRFWVLLGAACALSGVGSSRSWAAEANAIVTAAARCNALASTDFSTIPDAPTQVVEARLIEASADVPAFCLVRGYVTPNVGFKLQLPESGWNGKFFQAGCGGACGTTETVYAYGWDSAVRKGYATLTTDMGHKSGVQDGLWAYNNLQAQVDFGYRGTHVATLAGKAIVEHYYAKAPQRAYFSGCSTGGRQALVEAQRFPWDFDGIIAGGPWIDDTESAMDMVWAIRALRGPDGKSILSHADRKLIHDAALGQCDRDDGVADGLIGNPLKCSFNPDTLICAQDKGSGCLTAAQAEAVKKVYAGPMNSKGEKTFVGGPMPGSEMEWEHLVPTKAASSAIFHSRSLMEDWATEYFRYMIMPGLGSSWQLNDFDFDRDHKRLGSTSGSLLSAANPDLRKFKAAGGKLILYQGWNDPLGAIPEKTIDYYELTEKTMGGYVQMRDFARLFMIPGMGHCGGGGASEIEYLDYLEAWVEQGKAPDVVIGTHVDMQKFLDARVENETFEDRALRRNSVLRDPKNRRFTRPVYPYPIQAKYQGSGDPNKAESFVPVEGRSDH